MEHGDGRPGQKGFEGSSLPIGVSGRWLDRAPPAGSLGQALAGKEDFLFFRATGLEIRGLRLDVLPEQYGPEQWLNFILTRADV